MSKRERITSYGSCSGSHACQPRRRSALLHLKKHPAVVHYLRSNTNDIQRSASVNQLFTKSSLQRDVLLYCKSSDALPVVQTDVKSAAALSEAPVTRIRRREKCKTLFRRFLHHLKKPVDTSVDGQHSLRNSLHVPCDKLQAVSEQAESIASQAHDVESRSSKITLAMKTAHDVSNVDALCITPQRSTALENDSETRDEFSTGGTFTTNEGDDEFRSPERKRSDYAAVYTSEQQSTPLPQLRTLQLLTTEERIPAPQLRYTPANTYTAMDSSDVMDHGGSSLNDALSSVFTLPRLPKRRPKVFRLVKKPVEALVDRLRTGFMPLPEDELSPRVGYKLSASSVPKGPIGPRSLPERYKANTYLPELKGEEGIEIKRRLFHDQREKWNQQRASAFFGLFQTFKTNAPRITDLREENANELFYNALPPRPQNDTSKTSSSNTFDASAEYCQQSFSMSSYASSSRSSSLSLIAVCVSPPASFSKPFVPDAETRSSEAPIDILARALQTFTAGQESLGVSDVFAPSSSIPSPAGVDVKQPRASKWFSSLAYPTIERSYDVKSCAVPSPTALSVATSLNQKSSLASNETETYTDSDDILLFPALPEASLKYADVFF